MEVQEDRNQSSADKINETEVKTTENEKPSDQKLISVESADPISKLYQWGAADCDQYKIEKDGVFESRIGILQDFFIFNSITIVNIACGGLHTLALSSIGKVYSWGCNDDGALGRVSGKGEALPCVVDLDIPIDMISAGDSHSIAANSVHSIVYQWGGFRNTNGGFMEKPTHNPRRVGEDEFRKKKLLKILSGANHALILSDQKVYAWGDPETNVLGRLPLKRRSFQQGLQLEALGFKHVVDIYTGGYHSFLKQEKTNKKDKTVEHIIYAWGLNNYGQLGIGGKSNTISPTEIVKFRDLKIKGITGGEHHSIAVTEEGKLWVWGRNDEGQLGLGEGKEDFYDEPVCLESHDGIDKIVCGTWNSYAIKPEGSVFSWGFGDHYLLGNGKEENEYEPFDIKAKFWKNETLFKLVIGGQHGSFLTLTEPNRVPDFDHDTIKRVPESYLHRTRKTLTTSKRQTKKGSVEKSPSKENVEEEQKSEHTNGKEKEKKSVTKEDKKAEEEYKTEVATGNEIKQEKESNQKKSTKKKTKTEEEPRKPTPTKATTPKKSDSVKRTLPEEDSSAMLKEGKSSSKKLKE